MNDYPTTPWEVEHDRIERRNARTYAASVAARGSITRYATLAGIPGYAIRTADRRVFFIGESGMRELAVVDIPMLVLLGELSSAERQRTADHQAGGAARIACTRNPQGA